MKINLFASSEQLNQNVVDTIVRMLPKEQQRFNFAPTGGTTPLSLYPLLIPHLRQHDNIHYYTQDEVPFHPHEQENGGIFRHIERHLFAPAGVPDERIHALTGANYRQADQQIINDGGIDLLLLGLGGDGHIAANLPGTPFDSEAHRIEVDRSNQDMVNALANEAGSKEKVPDAYFSLGLKTIMRARNIFLLVTGEKKAAILSQALEGPLTEQVPASILRFHPSCTLFTDAGAAQQLTRLNSL
ncbi:MAG: Glucosamine-6-phosphate deaminase [Candidatus Erwinia impunctatus]|nr:Glucosamine-6-phosphate deaminase [Culicoides impunctatus]